VPVKVPLKKLVEMPESHADQVVVPEGMYHLARSRANSSSAPRQISVTERKLERSRRHGPLAWNSGFSTDLEVDPRLAENLDRLDLGQRENNLAILTVWVTKDQVCKVVKVEILENLYPRFKSGYLNQADVQYVTLTVTPAKSERGEVDDSEWQRLDRLLLLANDYRDRLNAQRNMLRTLKANQVQRVMNDLWGQTMRDVFTAAQQQQMRQRALLPR
jgi:hypothetical protein